MIRKIFRLYALFMELLLAAALVLWLAPTIRAETDPVQEERILNIYKSTGEGQPLAGIEIDIYLVASMEELGDLPLSPQPDGEETAKYAIPENRITTLTTDVQGFAAYNFTEHGNPDGVYLVVERFDPSTTGPVPPFYISIPAGEGETALDVHLKGTLETGPRVDLDVSSLDNDSSTYAVGRSHTWILRGQVPAGIGTAKSYILTHVLDERLTLEPGTLVNLHTSDGSQLTLRRNEHYQLEEGRTEGRDRLRLSLTPSGMAYVSSHLGEGDRQGEIRLSFRASINTSADMGATIPGLARLAYCNSAGHTYEGESDRPEVHTGGIHIAVTDSEGKPLEGAVFRLARLATDQDLADPDVRKDILYIDGKKEQVVLVSFYASADMVGEKTTDIMTGPQGAGLAYGLAYGSYYLFQAEAPSGYNRVTLPAQVTVSEVSHLTAADGWKDTEDRVVDNTVTVVNTKFILPDTGGMGSVILAMIGISMVGAAGPMLLRRHER